jgi:hypothetical protein
VRAFSIAHPTSKSEGEKREAEKRTKETTMKKNFNRTLILAAAALAFGAAAYGQDKITANIPFTFRASDGAHPAGTYAVISRSGDPVLQLRNEANGHSVNLKIGTPEGGGSGDARPRLVFHCQDDGGCVLAQVWTANGGGFSYPAPPVIAPKTESAVVVYYNGEVNR